MVAHVWWSFQFSQGIVETLFRWGRKHLYHFAAIVFRKWCTKFYQNRLSFVEDITKKNILVSFFLDTCVCVCLRRWMHWCCLQHMSIHLNRLHHWSVYHSISSVLPKPAFNGQHGFGLFSLASVCWQSAILVTDIVNVNVSCQRRFTQRINVKPLIRCVC